MRMANTLVGSRHVHTPQLFDLETGLYDEDSVQGKLLPLDKPEYDEDSDIEDNMEIKENLMEVQLIQIGVSVNIAEFMARFEELILENPHNCNVKVSQKGGIRNFKYVRDSVWVTVVDEDLGEVVSSRRVDKMRELLRKFKKDGSIKHFTWEYISCTLKAFRVLQKEQPGVLKSLVKQVVAVIETHQGKWKGLDLVYGKKIERVGTHSVAKSRMVLENPTWESLSTTIRDVASE